MPNGPDDRKRVREEAERRRSLAPQRMAQVVSAKNHQDFQNLLSSAANEEIALHSWNIAPDGTITAVFFPATRKSLEKMEQGAPFPRTG